MDTYGVRDVERLLHVSPSTLRSLVAAGFVTPARGPRNSWRFSFQDLIVLRTAQALAAARVPTRRILKALRELRRSLPESMPLSGLSLGAEGDRVAVRDGRARWQADSGQYLLELGGDGANATLRTISRAATNAGTAVPSLRGPAAAARSPRDPYAEALELEATDPQAALRAYDEAIAADPAHLDARINRALLLHEAGRHAEAKSAYADALETCGADPTLLFNLGVLLEDMSQLGDAVRVYRAAITVDPRLADGHYNIALLYRRLGRPREAIRHMSLYRRLTRSRV
jgi:tetratricopeptide (TPR) repeat protein